MGELEGWSHMGGGGGGGNRLLPNGLLPNASPLIESLDSERWLKAEERTAELITCIQPNQPSEARRNAVADYVQRLIMKCFPCQVFTFGSVPLKTYLPDGDIDLTAFSNNPGLKDSWASEVRDMLETEEKNENAEFHVKEVQYIQAEVKIIKCLVENIVVDISFNQLGGLCTLCFLEEVDNLINQNHLFKRSIILIKAWCYYESRILGAHHGLISTYALETLVLYIFHVFNNSFAGPLEVLYRFLEFFSNFDWDNFCVSLWGPVPINSLPDVTAEAPRKDSGELLLNKVFLDACSSVYAVFPGGQDNQGQGQGQPFLSKHFNVIDPLRVSNNLGRSVSKGNFFRIRSAFAFGAKRLARLLDCPKENLVAEVNQFFTNTWDRHGNGIRPDAPPLTTDSSLILKFSVGDFEDTKNSQNAPSVVLVLPHNQNQKNSARVSDSDSNANKGQRNLKSGHLVNDIQRSPFARTRSSPELTDTYKYVPFQAQGNCNKPPGPGPGPEPGPEPEPDTHSYRRKNVETERNQAQAQAPPHQSFEPSSIELNVDSNMHLEEQDLVNMMSSSSSAFHGFNGQVHMPSSGGQLPFPISPSFLASLGLGYTQRNFPALQFPHGLVSPQLTHYFSNDDLVDLGGEDSWDSLSSEIVPLPQEENKPQPSTGMNYVPPPRRVGGSGGLVRSQPKYNKEKREQLRDNNHSDHYQENERATSSRFSSASASAAHSNSLRSKTSSESSWDDSSSTVVPKSTRGKKTVIPMDQSEDDQDWVPPNLGSESESLAVARSSGAGSVIPMGPMIIGSNPRQRMMDNSGATPLTFYPTGPPVPFLTMLPFYNVPSENGSLEASASHFGMEESSIENGDIGQNFHSEESEEFGVTPGDEHKSDILNSDFASHWQNLQFGRFCQSPWHHGPTVYPSPVMVPLVYLQGRVPWDGPGRPVPNMNLVMNYGPRLVPVAPLQSNPNQNRPPNVYQHYVEDMPRYRSGTGTYLPNPKVAAVRDRAGGGGGPRSRGNYNYQDRSENHEGSWNGNSKSRGGSGGRNRNQMEKSTNSHSNSNRHDSFSFSTYQSQQNGPSTSQNMSYSMYPLPSGGGGGGSAMANGPAVVMVYPFEQSHNNAGFGSQSQHNNEQLEFGSFGPAGFSDVNEQSTRGVVGVEGSRSSSSSRGMLVEEHRASPDQPSSPHHQRRV